MHYSRDLALVHDRGFGQHADRCAPGILELLSPSAAASSSSSAAAAGR